MGIFFSALKIYLIDLVYLLTLIILSLELLKITKPGQNNSGHIQLMTLSLMGFLAVCTAALSGVEVLSALNTAECLVLLAMTTVHTVIISTWHNNQTLQV